MTAAEWALPTPCTTRGTAPNRLFGVSCRRAGSERILETARQIAKHAGWPIINLSVEDLRRDYRLPERGYLVIQGGNRRLAPEFVQAVAAFQHLVAADLPVALLVVAGPKAIQSLRREPALDGSAGPRPLANLARRNQRPVCSSEYGHVRTTRPWVGHRQAQP